jgi:hypothetical protein
MPKTSLRSQLAGAVLAFYVCLGATAPSEAVFATGERVPGEFATTLASASDLAGPLASFGSRFFTDAAFDGDWTSSERHVALRIAGNVGVATAAYPNGAPAGTTVLRLRWINRAVHKGGEASLPWFDGTAMRADGTWVNVQGRITPIGRLLLQTRATYPTDHWALDQGGTGNVVPLAQGTATMPGSTPAFATAPPSYTCVSLIGDELGFCQLMKEVGEQVGAGLQDKAWEIGIRSGMLFIFRSLPPTIQHELFTGPFLKAKYLAPVYGQSLSTLMAQPKPASFVDYGVGQVFCDMFKQTFDAYAEAMYLNSPTPWKYVYVQTAGDQMYVGLSLLLSPQPLSTPQARALEAVFIESQITVSRIRAASDSWFALKRERQEAIGSMAAVIARNATVDFLREQGLSPPVKALAAGGVDFAMATVRKSVDNTDISHFDEVARLAYQATMERLRAVGVTTASVTSLAAQAKGLAVQLDKQRPFINSVTVTAFGSYGDATDALLKVLDLTR